MSILRIPAVGLTEERFRPFGQVVRPTADGKPFDQDDARLDLSRGIPRFYIMRLPKRDRNWYLAVAKPSGSVKAYPKKEDLVAFRVPPGVFLKLEEGTWHAGPLFQESEHMDFYNLELSDTNVVDHNTHSYGEHGVKFEIQDA